MASSARTGLGRLRRAARGCAGLVVLGAAGVASSGCLFSGPSTITTTAYFSDVGNLVSGAPVQMAGITVGSVRSITLGASGQAKVVMSIERSAAVPSDVTADAEQSTVLGEEVVQLVAPRRAASAALLADRSTISHTALVPGIQQFVAGGTAVLGSIGTSQLAQVVNAGGEGFGGQAATLRSLIGDLNHVMTGYSTRTGEIRQLVGAIDQLSSSLAPKASSNAQAITNLAHTITILNQQSGKFARLLQGLDAVAQQGRSLLEQELAAIDFQFRSLAGVTSTLNGQQSAINTLLANLPGHNMVMHDVVVNRFAQVVDALIVCGLPNGGGNTTQAASSCHGAGGSGG